MGQATRSSSQEYWRPANPEVARLIDPAPVGAACWRCGMEYSPAARFCHFCGSPRDKDSRAQPRLVAPNSSQLMSGLHVLDRLGLSMPSLLFFVVGILCIIAAVITGAIFKTDTLLDWQAVQLWRIEWLLGAAAALLAGILLKIGI